MPDELPKSYYELHSDELKLLQFLLYHLKYKKEAKREKGRIRKIEVTKQNEKISFD